MSKTSKIMLVVPLMAFVFACATNQGVQQSASPADSAMLIDPASYELAGLPEIRDLPLPQPPKKAHKKVRSYVGVIRNYTNHEIFIPSQNSQGTLMVPPRGWIEFITWTDQVNFTAYVDGKPYRCFKIKAKRGEYPFMCEDYDFMAIIGSKSTAVEGLG
ncbi:MAG: hypothetical protein ACLFUU_05420 [Desulfobacteraceae bacterium]